MSDPVRQAAPDPKPDLDALRRAISEVVGDKGLVLDADAMAPYLAEPRGRYVGSTPFVVRPGSTEEVAAVVRLCAEAGVPIVPQGGNTGLLAGQTPFERGDEVLLSLSRMNRIRRVDPLEGTMTVEAGCILQSVQEAAAEVDRLFPVSLGAEGSCQIGGNISTNAGGIQVLRYGSMRRQVLGLEVVLPDGRVWNGLRRLRKDNTGYDLKQLFIGAEGTLGIVTAAVLELAPRPRSLATAFVAFADLDAAIQVFSRARASLGDALTSFELIPRVCLDMAEKHVSGSMVPIEGRHDWHALIEAGSVGEGGLDEAMESFLAEAFEAELLPDAAIAQSEQQRADFWFLREAIVEAQKSEGGSIKHDVTLPITGVPDFIRRATEAVEALIPGIRPLAFGHVGDGNVHFNLSQPEGADSAEFMARYDEVNRLVHDIVIEMAGSISAEHGVGRMKVAENARTKDPLEIELMRTLKRALDPKGLMNPGKVVADD